MLNSKVGVWVAQLTPTPQLAWRGAVTILDTEVFLDKKWEGLSGVVPAPPFPASSGRSTQETGIIWGRPERHDDEQSIRKSQRQPPALLIPRYCMDRRQRDYG